MPARTELVELEEPPPPGQTLRDLLSRVTEPSPEIVQPEERRRVRLVLSVVLILMLVGALMIAGALVMPTTLGGESDGPSDVPLLVGGTLALTIVYALSRGRHYMWGAFLAVTIAWYLTILAAVGGSDPTAGTALVFLAVPLFISSVVLPLGVTLAIAGVALASPFLLPGLKETTISLNLVAFFTVFTFLALGVHQVRARDLDQIDRQASKLAQSEERNRQLLAATFEGVAVHRDLELVDANPTFATLFGCELAQLPGQRLDDFLEDPSGRGLASLVEGSHGVSFEAVGHDRTGTRFPVECRSKPIEYEGEALRVTVVRDITERRQIERERARRAQEQARREELEQLVWLTSHALRTPVRTIKSFSQLVARRHGPALDEVGREYLGYVQDGARDLDALMQDLRTFAELFARDQPLEPVTTHAVVQRVLDDLCSRVEEEGARVEVGELPTVQGDPVQLYHVFHNLLSNALTFHEGDPRIAVTAEREGNHWRLAITDDGVGIAPHHRDRAFEIFHRLAPERFPGGTGMGLALCKRVVERHGGTIEVEAGPDGRGTRVSFTLPAKADPDAFPGGTALSGDDGSAPA